MSHTESTRGDRTRADNPPAQRRSGDYVEERHEEAYVGQRNHDEAHRDHDYDRDHDRHHDGEHGRPVVAEDHDHAREKFGGVNVGACFFGWLVAMAVAILLTSIVGAVAAGLGANANVTQTDAQRSAGTVGLVAGIVLVVVLLVAYYTGGYVAGRMSRFDGAKQGLGVWIIGLVVTILAVAAGVVFGSQYNILDRVSLPRIPIPTDQMTTGGIITAVVVVLGTLLLAMLGGKVGHRYHDRVDRAALR